MEKRVMHNRKMIIVFVVFVILLLGLVSFFLVNGFNSSSSTPSNDFYSNEQINEPNSGDLTTPEGDDTVVSEATSSGGSSSSGVNAVTPGLTCIDKKIKYSLKNFNEDINCLENELGKCVKLSAICSVDIYNIDENVDSNFTIEYALVDRTDNDLETLEIQKNVNISTPVKFSVNFTVEDSGGLDVLSKCTPRILEVPEKRVCS